MCQCARELSCEVRCGELRWDAINVGSQRPPAASQRTNNQPAKSNQATSRRVNQLANHRRGSWRRKGAVRMGFIIIYIPVAAKALFWIKIQFPHFRRGWVVRTMAVRVRRCAATSNACNNAGVQQQRCRRKCRRRRRIQSMWWQVESAADMPCDV